MAIRGWRLGHTWSLVRRWWEPSRPQLTCACCPFPRAHCPPHPRSDCSVLRLPFAVLFCKGRRGHGRGGWRRPKPRGDKTKGQNRKYRVGTREGSGKERQGLAHGKGNKNQSQYWMTNRRHPDGAFWDKMWSQVKIERMLSDPEIHLWKHSQKET